MKPCSMHTSLAESERRPAQLLIRDLVAGYRGIPIVNGVTLSVGEREVVSVLGPNGAGKSTLLKALVGLLPVMAGSIELDGVQITNMSPEDLVRMGTGYVPQVRDVFEPLTVRENLDIGGYLLDSRQIKDRAAEVLALFPSLQRAADRRAGTLSGGERKMLAIARVLMLRPKLLILDEPTAGLAPEVSKRFLHEHVRRLISQGVSTLLVEQRVSASLEISDWAYVLVTGEVRREGRPADLLQDREFAQVFLGRRAELPAIRRESNDM